MLIAGGGTGGHLMPALALGSALRQEHPDWRIVLVGAERGVEARLLPAREFPFQLLPAEPIYRRQWWKNLRWPLLATRLIREVDRLLTRERPALVIGTGGYAAGPVVWRAARRGIPTAMLELNAYPGLAVRWLAGAVREIWLGSPEARARLRPGPHTEIVDTGTPISPPDPSQREAVLQRFGLDPARPVLLITGGSQGALPLNLAVAEWIQSGAARSLQVLWATGRGSFGRFEALHHPPLVQVYDYLDPIGPAYAVATLALARAGMMTLAELCAWGVPSILVPLPSAAADHQTSNARAMQEAGAAICLPQKELTPARLEELVQGLLADPSRRAALRAAALGRARPEAIRLILRRIGLLSG
ncbi:MAG TPA: UDP-N-acetylglucosamine--N-acetylmuramyl-(pentapeptide) pyrophosphoryl-undecaprenol N-acetylglucosamine transferase [Gemmatimonadales bacterium]|nr:UDP-N-acetylglucosamine--N-acetylmuramyl-(pentapeptide) pyrophosphoryl-undecaprenol N-acetylglucosamine transferase [Gemmatimonadales bacterium]